MEECKVVQILSKPEKDRIRFDHMSSIEYWAVKVMLKQKDGEYESYVTFETEEKAQNLQIGDVFFR